MHARHLGDKRIALGHVADEAANLFGVGRDVLTEDARRARVRGMKAQERVDERGLPRAVRAEQADGAAIERAAQVLQDRTPAKGHAQTVEINNWNHNELKPSWLPI